MTIKYGVNESHDTKIMCDMLNRLEKRVKNLEEIVIIHMGVKIDGGCETTDLSQSN